MADGDFADVATTNIMINIGLAGHTGRGSVMGEVREHGPTSVQQLRADWRSLVETGKAMSGTGLESMAEQMQRQGSPPADVREAPVIIDTDIGGDADDALALAAAARSLSSLALVLTSDETGPGQGSGQRARFARWLLDALGCADVPVAAGASHGDTRYLCVQQMVPDWVPRQSDDVLEEVRRVCRATHGPVRWVGMGPLTNLAMVLQEAPELANQLHVTQMGGGLNYRDPERGEHNMRLDVSAVETVLKTVAVDSMPFEFVTSEITFTPQLEVTATSPLYATLAAPDVPEWARILREHMDAWFQAFHPGTIQHDALTLTAALQLPFVDSEPCSVAFDERGRMRAEKDGTSVWLSISAEYAPFMRWLTTTLDPAGTAGEPASVTEA